MKQTSKNNSKRCINTHNQGQEIIFKIAKLDNYLRFTLRYLRDSENPDKGVVAACLIGCDGNLAYSTSSRAKSGRWIHAERSVLELYCRKYGFPSEDLTMIVTLSPCVKDSESREGISCCDLLMGRDDEFSEIKIPRLHVGMIDKKQANLDYYEQADFVLTQAHDSELEQACGRLYNYFKPDIRGKISIQSFLDSCLSNI